MGNDGDTIRPPWKAEPAEGRGFQPTELPREKNQIVAILKEVELGAKVGETCRKHGVSERANLLQMEKPVLGHGGLAPGAAARTVGRERPVQAHVRRPGLMHNAFKDDVDRKL